MSQALLFIVAVVGMLSIVPLVTWAATGSASRMLEALRGYLLCMGILAAIAAVGAVAALIGSIP